MKQSNCYLYEYESNQQVRNVGFVKYIQEESVVKFQIHGKGLNCSKDEKYEMYIFAGKTEACYVSRAGEVETEHGRINYMVTVEGITQEQFSNYDGIYLHVGDEKRYVAMWNKGAVCFDKVESYNYLPVEDYYEEDCCEEACHHHHEEECCEEVRHHHHEEECCEEACHHHHDEECCEEVCHHHEEECSQEEMIEGPCDHDFLEEEERNSDISYEKIERQDIAKLPQREWKLANNSFLLHGYHNYQHILFIQEAGRSFIGVPGVYVAREADAAKNFGFPVFHRVDKRDMRWEEGEREYGVDFGYWCREVTYHNRKY